MTNVTRAALRAMVKPWAPGVAWAAGLLALGLWLSRTTEIALRQQLVAWQFWALEFQFLALVALSVINFRAFVSALLLRKQTLLLGAASAALALAITLFVAPKTNRIYYDEHIYQGIGQNLADLRLAQMCNDGNVEYGQLQCWRGEYNKEPYAYPYILSVLYRIGGAREGAAFLLNPILSACGVFLVFLITTALVGDGQAGVFAGLVAALTPEHLRWSHTAAAEPSAAAACALAVLTALAFARLRTTRSLLWMTTATVFAVQFRPECLLIVPVVGVIVLTQAPDEIARVRFWYAALAGLFLGAVHLGHLAAVRNEGWGSSGPRLSIAYFAANLRTNGWFYLRDARFPATYTALALCGLGAWRQHRQWLLPAVYLLLFWGIFLFFYAGSYNYGADDRFSLMTTVPIAILAGTGMHVLSQALTSAGRLSSNIASWVLVIALGVQFSWYFPATRATGEEAWGARADVAFARAVVGGLPKNSIVLTHNPHMFHLWGQSAAQVSLASTDSGYAENILFPRYAGGVYLHWNFWCNVADPLQQSFCSNVLDRFPHQLVREYRERNYRYAIYLLSQPPAAPHSEHPNESRIP